MQYPVVPCLIPCYGIHPYYVLSYSFGTRTKDWTQIFFTCDLPSQTPRTVHQVGDIQTLWTVRDKRDLTRTRSMFRPSLYGPYQGWRGTCSR